MFMRHKSRNSLLAGRAHTTHLGRDYHVAARDNEAPPAALRFRPLIKVGHALAEKCCDGRMEPSIIDMLYDVAT